MTIRATDAFRFLTLLVLVALGVVTTVGSGGGGPVRDLSDEAFDPVTGGPKGDMVIAAHGGSVLVVDAASFQAVREIALGTAPGNAIDLTAGGSNIFFPDSREAIVRAIDAGEVQLAPVRVSYPTPRGTAAAGGSLLYLTEPDPGGGKAAVVATLDGTSVVDLPLIGLPVAVAANHPLGQRVYVLTTNAGAADITVIDAMGTGVGDQLVVERFALPAGSGWAGLAVDPDNESLYVTSTAGLSVVDVKAGSPTRNSVVTTLPLSAAAGDMALSGNRRLFVLTPGSGFAVIDILPGSATRHTVVGSGPSGTSARFLAADDSGVVYLADDSDATRLVADAQAPDQYIANASVHLPRPASGIGFHKGANGLPDRLYVSLGASGPVQFTLFDGDFPIVGGVSDVGWDHRVLFDNTAAAAGGVQVDVATHVNGGSPGGFLDVSHQWTGGTDANGSPRGFEIVHTRTGAVYVPGVSGAIDHIDWSFDDRVISRSAGVQGVASFPIVCQAGNCFQLYQESQLTSWSRHSYPGLKNTDFINPLAGPVHPDFSATGNTIEFGHGTGSSSPTALPLITESGIDNWSVTVVLKP